MIDLSGKRVLFFSAKAFGIPENIVQCMKSKGAQVDYYDERPANSFLVKALIRINRNIIGSYINSYHKRIINNCQNIKYDYIFFIKAESFSENNLKALFESHPESKTIIYHWDSIANNHNAKKLLKYFDYTFSFDRYDCLKSDITFLPLFYFNEYKSVAKSTKRKKYDLLFVGTAHSDRYRLITSIADQIRSYGGSCFTYFFFQDKIMYYRYLIMNKEIRGINPNDVHFDPIRKVELLDLYAQSQIIVDIQHPKQTGLTLRCMEALGANKKLITTNKDISTYDFYNPSNILIVDRNNPIVPKSFIERPFEEVDEEIYKKYSISSWVDKIFDPTIEQYSLISDRKII